MLDHAGAFEHLKRIELDHNYVSAALAAELGKLGPEVSLADAEAPDEEYRYCRIGE